jgi:hypothetical protein
MLNTIFYSLNLLLYQWNVVVENVKMLKNNERMIN